MSMLLIFIYFCAMCFGDVHVAHLYIFLCYVFWWCPCCSFIYFCVIFVGDVHVAHLYIFLCYVFWWCPCCSFIYFCVIFFCDVPVAHLYIFLCIVFVDVHVTHLYIFLCNTEIYKWATWTSPKNITQKYIKMSNMEITKKHNTEIYKDEKQRHQKKK
jgi:hypothetical protein